MSPIWQRGIKHLRHKQRYKQTKKSSPDNYYYYYYYYYYYNCYYYYFIVFTPNWRAASKQSVINIEKKGHLKIERKIEEPAEKINSQWI